MSSPVRISKAIHCKIEKACQELLDHTQRIQSLLPQIQIRSTKSIHNKITLIISKYKEGTDNMHTQEKQVYAAHNKLRYLNLGLLLV